MDNEEVRYKFVQDDDCGWYLIPAALHALFIQHLEYGEHDHWAAFNNRFEEYRCDYPGNFTFTCPS